MTRLEQLAEVMKDGQWHLNSELVEKAGPRFGAAMLDLKKGRLDGNHWEIEKDFGRDPGVVRYRHVGYRGGYRTHPLKCPKCDRTMAADKTDGEYVGHVTTVKQTTLLDQATERVAKAEGTIEWQAAIIRKLEAELKQLKGRLNV